jgi:hypothetical protein
MDSMIERVARAIEGEIDKVELVSASPEVIRQIRARRIALAAIAAMRDPTDLVAEAVWAETGDPCWKENAIEAWQAGIDAALQDTP